MRVFAISGCRLPQSILRIPTFAIVMLCELARISTAVAGDELQKTNTVSNKSNAEVVTVFRSAYGEWRRRLKVKGNYSMVSGTVGRLADVNDRGALRNPEAYRGFLAVADGLWRLKHIPQQAPQVIDSGFTPGKSITTSFIKYLATDEVYDGRIFLSFKPEQPRFKSAAQVMGGDFIKPDRDGVRRAPGMLPTVLNPIEPLVVHPGGMPGEPFPLTKAESFDVTAPSPTITRLHVIVPDPVAYARTGDTIEYTCEWDSSLALPMIKHIEYAVRDKTNHIRTEAQITLEQPCTINGVPIASRVKKLVVVNALNTDGESVSHYLVTHWVSEDLCRDLPSRQDFVVELPQGTMVSGLKTLSNVKAPTRLDITELELDALSQPGEALGSSKKGRQSPSQRRNGRAIYLLLVINGLGVIVTYSVYRYYVRRTTK